MTGRTLRLPTAHGCPPLQIRLDRPVPYPADTIRSVTLLLADGRLHIDVTAELPTASYPPGQQPDPDRIAGVDLGIIHPFAVTTPDNADALLVSGRAVRAEHRLHLADTKGRNRATAARAPAKGQRGSRRWRKTRRQARLVEGRHRRRVRQALHEAATTVIRWAVDRRIGTLTVGDPRGVLDRSTGHRHNLRLRQWQIGRTLQILQDKATPPVPTGGVVTHRRAGQHLPGVGTARRDPRRRPPWPAAAGSLGRRRPALTTLVGSRSLTSVTEDPQTHRNQPGERLRTPH
ncbi:transposase [Paractinoplanes tereljensis]